jgi:hypothetical protein
MGFILWPDDSDNLNINVFTLTDFPIMVGQVQLPANDNQISFSLPTDKPYTHLVDNIPFKTTSTNEYSEIRVRSSLIQVVAQWDFTTGILVKGWDSTTENDYATASSANDPEANDLYRQQHKFEHVFKTLLIDPKWDGTIDNENVLPIALDDGTVTTDVSQLPKGQTQPPYWGFNKRLSRTLPFLTGFDYSVYPPADTGTEATDEDLAVKYEYVPCMVLYQDKANGDAHTADNKWHMIEKLDATNEDLAGIRHKPLDNAFGVQLEHSPNHYMALGTWANDSPGDTNTEPEIDYRNCYVIGMFESDVRQQIAIQTGLDTPRNLLVDVESAKYVMCCKNQVVGLDPTGGLQLIADDPDALVIHDDNDQDHGSTLQAIATQLAAWYAYPRQAIEIPIKTLGWFADVGALLTSIDMIDSSTPVGTPVTSVHMDFDSGHTVIKTAYHELDFTSLTGRKEDFGMGADVESDD